MRNRPSTAIARASEPRELGLLALLGCVVSCLGVAACSEGPTSRRPSDVLLISMDTLRADRLQAYGYDRAISPHIDQLASQAAVFERAYTHAAHTLAAHASMLTGLYPERHGALDEEGSIAPGIVTLAETLASEGYQTGGFANAIWLTPHFNMDRGFQTFSYERAALKQEKRDAEETNAAIFEWVDQLSDAPYFLFAHYYDVHSDWDRLPYDAPLAYRQRFAGPEPPGFKAGEEDTWATSYLIRRILKDDFFNDQDRAYVERLYDAGVAYADAQVGELLTGLRERGRLDSAIIILTSDHGEEFQEHGMLLHTQVYEEGVRVPLLVSFPEMRGTDGRGCESAPGGLRASRIPHMVQHIDLFPTLTECLGVESPDGLQGKSLVAALRGGQVGRDAVYLVSPHGAYLGNQFGVIRDGWKLLEFEKGGRLQLYDLTNDPKELHDLSEQYPDKVAALADELARHRAANADGRVRGKKAELSAEDREALRALGYLSNADTEWVDDAKPSGGSDGPP